MTAMFLSASGPQTRLQQAQDTECEGIIKLRELIQNYNASPNLTFSLHVRAIAPNNASAGAIELWKKYQSPDRRQVYEICVFRASKLADDLPVPPPSPINASSNPSVVSFSTSPCASQRSLNPSTYRPAFDRAIPFPRKDTAESEWKRLCEEAPLEALAQVYCSLWSANPDLIPTAPLPNAMPRPIYDTLYF